MANPLAVRSIAGHLVWGTDGAVWACFEVEPFAYAHRSVRDARGVHARTAAALLALPAHSLILSVAHSLSREELEDRVRGTGDLIRPPGWAGTARRVADRLMWGDDGTPVQLRGTNRRRRPSVDRNTVLGNASAGWHPASITRGARNA